MSVYFKHIAATRVLIGVLCLSILFVFLTIIEQQRIGLSEVLRVYVKSFFVFHRFDALGLSIPIFPGGYSILYAYCAVFTSRLFSEFTLSLDGLGKSLINLSLLSLLLSYCFIELSKTESKVDLSSGETSDYGQDQNSFEVSLSIHAQNGERRIFSIPQHMLERGQTIRRPELPFNVRFNDFVLNSLIREREEFMPSDTRLADKGEGKDVYVLDLPNSRTGVSYNSPSVYATVFGEEQAIGTWLLHEGWKPQSFTYNGQLYSLRLRPKKIRFPFALRLLPKLAPSNETTIQVFPKNTNITPVELKNSDSHAGYFFYFENTDQRFEHTRVWVKQIPGKFVPRSAILLLILGLLIRWLASFREKTREVPE